MARVRRHPPACPKPSALGDWSYEPYDTKLARETRGGTILQLSVYVDLLEDIQQRAPGAVLGRDARATMTRHSWSRPTATPTSPPTSASSAPSSRPRWRWVTTRSGRRTTRSRSRHATSAAGRSAATRRRRDDDHLSFIAGIGRVHREELTAQGFPTLATAAAMPLPIAFKPSRGSRDTYTRIREQARVQHRTADAGPAGARAAAAGRGRAGPRASARAVARGPVPRSGGREVRPRRRPRVSVRAVGPSGGCARRVAAL